MVSKEERTRRNLALREAMDKNGYALLILYGDSRWGKSGWVQYLFNYFLFNRQGYGVFPIDGDPSLIFPQRAPLLAEQAGEKHLRADSGIDDEHVNMSSFKKIMDDLGVKEGSKVGLVNYIDMPAAEYIDLVKNCSTMKFDDATSLFNSVRMIKSAEEIRYLRNSNLAAEHSFHNLLDTLKVGADEKDVRANALHALYKMGARDSIFHAINGQNGDCSPVPGLPGDSYIYNKNDVTIPIIELCNLDGYWTEFSRVLCLGDMSDFTKKMNNAMVETLELADEILVPGITYGEIWDKVDTKVSKLGFHLQYIGHGIGTDVLEGPNILKGSTTTLAENMTIAFHPKILDEDEKRCTYVNDIYLVTNSGGKALSAVPREPIRI
jgi:Xaa-Pro aminopeptidase